MLQYPAAYLVPNIITAVGWREAWIYIGGANICFGLLMLITVKEPPKPNVVENDVAAEEMVDKQRSASLFFANQLGAETEI